MWRHTWKARAQRGNKTPRGLPQPPTLPWHREKRPCGAYQRFRCAPDPADDNGGGVQDAHGRDGRARPTLAARPWPESWQTWSTEDVRTRQGGRKLPLRPSRLQTTKSQMKRRSAYRTGDPREDAHVYFEEPAIVSAAVGTLLAHRDDELRRRSAACLLAAECATHSEKQLAETQARLRVSQQRSDDLLEVMQRIGSPTKYPVAHEGYGAPSPRKNTEEFSPLSREGPGLDGSSLSHSMPTQAGMSKASPVTGWDDQSMQLRGGIDTSAEREFSEVESSAEYSMQDSNNTRNKSHEIDVSVEMGQLMCTDPSITLLECSRMETSQHESVLAEIDGRQMAVQTVHERHGNDQASDTGRYNIAAVKIQSRVRGAQVRSRGRRSWRSEGKQAAEGLCQRPEGLESQGELTMEDCTAIFEKLDTNHDGKILPILIDDQNDAGKATCKISGDVASNEKGAIALHDPEQHATAARDLQRRVRALLASGIMEQAWKCMAAARIQSCTRGYDARRKAFQLKEERVLQQEHARAIAVIQSRVRSMQGRVVQEAARELGIRKAQMSALVCENGMLKKMRELEANQERCKFAGVGKAERARLPLMQEQLQNADDVTAAGNREKVERNHDDRNVLLERTKALEADLNMERRRAEEYRQELLRVSEINQQVQEELKIEVESLSAMRRERLSMQEELRMEREGRESERARLLEIQQRIASLAWREAEREEELNAERETLEEVEAREAGKRAVLEAQLSEAKKRESEVEMREQQKRAALEEELRSATASISRLECKDVIACEKTSALEVQLKKAQEVVKALEVDAKAEKEKHATTMAQEQERADTNSMRVSELTIELKAARECLLHLERREKEAVARLEGEIMVSMSRWAQRESEQKRALEESQEQVRREQELRRTLEESVDRKRVLELERNAAHLLAMHRQLALKMLQGYAGDASRVDVVGLQQDREAAEGFVKDDFFADFARAKQAPTGMRQPFPPHPQLQLHARNPKIALLSPVSSAEAPASAQEGGGGGHVVGRGRGGLRELRALRAPTNK